MLKLTEYQKGFVVGWLTGIIGLIVGLVIGGMW